MGVVTSRLPLDKLDCRKASRSREELVNDNNGDDNIPLMGISGEGDEADPSHNPDAWTPMEMTSIDPPAADLEQSAAPPTKEKPKSENANAPTKEKPKSENANGPKKKKKKKKKKS